MFNGQFGLPVRWNEEKIVEEINSIQETYFEEDYYFLFEEKSNKLDFFILNDSNQFLEDVKICFYFDKTDFMISEYLPKKPVYQSIYSVPDISRSFPYITGYPTVYDEDEKIVVVETIESLRHKEKNLHI